MAELDGKVVGSNLLDERNCIAGVGPITVDPSVQHKTIGRQLMEDVHHRARQKNLPGVRLIQAGYHVRSLSLYAKLGYDVREPLACLQGPAINDMMAGYGVRPATPGDLESCNRVCRQVHGHERGGELLDAVRRGTAQRRRTRRAYHRLRLNPRFLWARRRREQQRTPSSHWRGPNICRPRLPLADS